MPVERRLRCTIYVVIAASSGCGGGGTPPQSDETAPGAQRTGKTAALETGAKLMQAKEPVGEIAMDLVGFHPSKARPESTMTIIRGWRALESNESS
jgi:hypothetical protein